MSSASQRVRPTSTADVADAAQLSPRAGRLARFFGGAPDAALVSLLAAASLLVCLVLVHHHSQLQLIRAAEALGTEHRNDVLALNDEHRHLERAAIGAGLIAMIGVARLIREMRGCRKVAQQLSIAAARNQAILANAAAGVIVVDERGIIQTFNGAAERIFQRRAHDLIGRNVSTIMPEPHRDRHGGYLRRYLETGQSALIGAMRELSGVRGDGSVFALELALTESVSAGERTFTAIVNDISARKNAEAALAERTQLSELTACIAVAITRLEGTRSTLQHCAELLVAGVDGAFARFWSLDESEQVLHLQASAGLYTHIDGGHARVPVGQFKIGQIAREGRPHVTNAVADDPRIGDREWARREGMIAFAGYPLIVANRVVGVMALFARHTLSDAALAGLASAADMIALYLQRQRAEEELLATTAALRTNNEALRIASAAANAANLAKSEFLANMSHEIRTPMTAILGYADLLSESDENGPLSPARLDAVRTIRHNGEHLLGVINDMLELSNVQAGLLTAEFKPCDPRAIAEEVVRWIEPQAAAKRLTLDVRFEDSTPASIQTDPFRLRQVLINLVGNAVKFTEFGGVRVVARGVATRPIPTVEFDVIDTGVGMNPDRIAAVFRPFEQGDSSVTRRFGGTGLGLAISRRLANLLKGDVEIVATRPGGGTHVRLWIASDASVPDAATTETHGARPPIETATASTRASDDRRVPPAAAESDDRTEAAPSADDPADIAGLRILLAEDGPDNQMLMSHLLRKGGAEVTVVDNGRAALLATMDAAARGRPFDAVLMDMQMPIMDGYEATAELRRTGLRAPIIALTAHALSGDRERCLAAGCDAYAAKPISRAQLYEAIVNALRAREQASGGAQLDEFPADVAAAVTESA